MPRADSASKERKMLPDSLDIVLDPSRIMSPHGFGVEEVAIDRRAIDSSFCLCVIECQFHQPKMNQEHFCFIFQAIVNSPRWKCVGERSPFYLLDDTSILSVTQKKESHQQTTQCYWETRNDCQRCRDGDELFKSNLFLTRKQKNTTKCRQV